MTAAWIYSKSRATITKELSSVHPRQTPCLLCSERAELLVCKNGEIFRVATICRKVA